MVAVNRAVPVIPVPSGAPALRFLALCIGGWIALRALMLWSAATPAPPMPVAPPWFPPVLSGAPDRGAITAATAPIVQRVAHRDAPRRPRHAATPGVPDLGADLPQLSLALMARLFPAASPRAAAAEPRRWSLAAAPAPARAAPGRGGAFWMQRQLSGLSASAWVYLRDGDGRSLGGDGQLGGSQAGFRVAHALAGDGALRVYGRATAALRRPEQSELALGLAFAPASRLPVDVAVERRVGIGHEGRSAFAAMVVGGLSALPLPHDFRLDAYGEAGVVGLRRGDVFADGAISIDREIAAAGPTRVSVGGMAAGAIQPGVARVDVGPRLTLRLPDVGQGSSIALDWRQRVAGGARPESGLALTLASDF